MKGYNIQEYAGTCPHCLSDNLIIADYDPVWNEGEIWCNDCGEYIRLFDGE